MTITPAQPHKAPPDTDLWVWSAVIVVFISAVVKVSGVILLIIAERADARADYYVEFGYAFGVMILWMMVEFLIAVPTIISVAILLKYFTGGNRGLPSLAFPALLLNAPAWCFLVYIAVSG